MRLVDADALLEYLMINMGWHDEDGIAVDDSDEKRAIFKDLLDGVSTIDAVPVKHGRWLEKAVGNILQSAKCSACRKNHITLYEDYFTHYDYCPNCGAIMDEKKVEE